MFQVPIANWQLIFRELAVPLHLMFNNKYRIKMVVQIDKCLFAEEVKKIKGGENQARAVV